MPVLIDLHEKFHDKGLAIVGVHLDLDGEVDSVEKLNEKVATHKKKLWSDRDLPFPNALISATVEKSQDGEAGTAGVTTQYGVEVIQRRY